MGKYGSEKVIIQTLFRQGRSLEDVAEDNVFYAILTNNLPLRRIEKVTFSNIQRKEFLDRI